MQQRRGAGAGAPWSRLTLSAALITTSTGVFNTGSSANYLVGLITPK